MRDSTTPRDARLARFAARHHGVVSVGQLRSLGFDRDAIARRVEAGRLHRLHRGVYAVGHTIVPPRGRWLAAVLACGDGAVLSHRTAAAHWGIRPSAAARIDVTVPHTSGVRSTQAIVVHRSRRPIERVTRDGIPVTTAGRTLADLATALPRRPLEKACEAAEALELDVEIDPAHPGAQRLAEIDVGVTTRSPLEDDFLELCDRFGIPRPRVNTIVEGLLVDSAGPRSA
jgi:predicted transcriptional regulator of viral defense system